MSEDIRKMIDKVKNFKQFVNEEITTTDNTKDSGFLGKAIDGLKKIILGKNIYKFIKKVETVATFNDFTLKFNSRNLNDGANQFIIDILKNDEKVGKFVAFFYEDKKTKKVSLQIQKVKIYPKYKGNSIMKTFYQDFNNWLKTNFDDFGDFNSDFVFLYNKNTGGYDGFNMWEKLVEKGLAKRNGPPENYIPPITPQDGGFWYLKTGYTLL